MKRLFWIWATVFGLVQGYFPSAISLPTLIPQQLMFKQGELEIVAGFAQAPKMGHEAILLLLAKDPKTHKGIEIAETMKVSLWMPTMGHGSAPTQTERLLDESGAIIPGGYRIRNLYFVMTGEWEVQVNLSNGSDINETQAFPISIN